MKRFAQLIHVKKEAIAEYERIHTAVWPEVLATIERCNIRNYSIFRHGALLIAYFEYHGDDYETDMAKMAADPQTQAWWKLTDPMQEPLPDHAEGAWWTEAKEVFHTD
jgi:L-rhamnose mutarotase